MQRATTSPSTIEVQFFFIKYAHLREPKFKPLTSKLMRAIFSTTYVFL